ncbi:MAG TPA: hypothetical protein EYP98_10175 [Planctomycetes bacterium]|nr:hypothetical protein [Planctomycetota bacterium]
MWASTDELSISAGGSLDFTHIVDTERTGDVYYLLGSFAGTSPGTLLPGSVILPLNVDPLLLGMVTHPNIGVFIDTVGMIDAQGGAASAVLIPPGLLLPVLIGQDMSLVHALIDGTGLVVEISNVVTVTMTL